LTDTIFEKSSKTAASSFIIYQNFSHFRMKAVHKLLILPLEFNLKSALNHSQNNETGILQHPLNFPNQKNWSGL